MDSVWVKIAIFAVVIVAVIVVIGKLLPSREALMEPKPEQTYYDVTKEDDKRLRAEPKFKEPARKETAEETTAQGPAQQSDKSSKPQFRELTEAEKAEAERLLEWAIQTRKMGRLPVVSFKQTVDACRQIIERFPGTEYEFKAKRILADIPEHYRSRYKITDDEIDLGNLE